MKRKLSLTKETNKKAKIALYCSPESRQVSSQFAHRFKRSSKYIFKMAILDFRLEQISLFWIYKSPGYFLPTSKSVGLSVQEKKFKIDFQFDGHFEFLTDTVLAIVD